MSFGLCVQGHTSWWKDLRVLRLSGNHCSKERETCLHGAINPPFPSYLKAASPCLRVDTADQGCSDLFVWLHKCLLTNLLKEASPLTVPLDEININSCSLFWVTGEPKNKDLWHCDMVPDNYLSGNSAVWDMTELRLAKV